MILLEKRKIEATQEVFERIEAFWGSKASGKVEQYHKHINVYWVRFLVGERDGVGYVVVPKVCTTQKVLLYARGGVQDIGKWNVARIFYQCGKIAECGIPIFAPQYAGVAGGGGVDQIGGDDVNDLLVGPQVLEEILGWKPVGYLLWGESRGMIMVCKVAGILQNVLCIMSVAGVTDIKRFFAYRGDAKEIRSGCFPQTNTEYEKRNPKELLKYIPHQLEFFLAHGTQDTRVHSEDTIAFSQILKERGFVSSLHLYEGSGHTFGETDSDFWDDIFNFIHKYLP